MPAHSSFVRIGTALILVIPVFAGCAASKPVQPPQPEPVVEEIKDRTQEMRAKVQSEISASSSTAEGVCESLDTIIATADKIATVYGTQPDKVISAAKEAFEVFRSTSSGSIGCSLSRMCSVSTASDCIRSVYSKCVSEQANLLFKRYDEATVAGCVDESLLQSSQADSCVAALMPEYRRTEYADVLKQYGDCFCIGVGKRLVAWSHSGDLAAGWNQTLQSHMGRCPREKIGDVTAIDSAQVWAFMSEGIYGASAATASKMFQNLGYFGVVPTETEFTDFIKVLAAKRPDYDKDFLDAVVSGAAAGTIAVLGRPLCDISLKAIDFSRELDSAQAANLANACGQKYEAWAKSGLATLIKTKQYGVASRFISGHLQNGPLAPADWLTKARATIDADVAKSREALASAAEACLSGSRKGLDMMAKVRCYGVLDEELAAARDKCLTDCDQTALGDMGEKLKAKCKNGEQTLFNHVKSTRKSASTAALKKLFATPFKNVDQFTGSMETALGDDCTAVLKGAASDVFKCRAADEKLTQALSLLRAMEIDQAFRLAIEAESEYERPEMDDFANLASDVLPQMLSSRAEAAYRAGMLGVGWAYQVIMERLFPQQAQTLASSHSDAASGLASLFDVRKYMTVSNAFTSGQMGKRLAPELGNHLSAAITNGGVRGGLPVMLLVRRVDSGWTQSTSNESRTHRYTQTRSVPNQEKQNACNAVPGARSNEAAARAAMQEASRQCSRLAGATQRQVGHGLLGGLVGGIVNAGCSIASQELLYSKARENKERFEYQCNNLPSSVEVREQKEFRYNGVWYTWNYQTSVSIDVANQAGEVICTVQDSSRSERRDLAYDGRSDLDLATDYLQEPNHDQILKDNFESLVTGFGSRVDKCVAENMDRFIDGQLKATVAGGSIQERNMEREIRRMGATTRSIPDFNAMKSLIEAILPIANIETIMNSHPGRAG